MKDILPNDAGVRKTYPITTGVLDYFPNAIAEVARVSKVGNDQHNPGEPMHWARDKSSDHADCINRHLVDRGKIDKDGLRHTAKVAWRALALLEEELEAAGAPPGRASVFPLIPLRDRGLSGSEAAGVFQGAVPALAPPELRPLKRPS